MRALPWARASAIEPVAMRSSKPDDLGLDEALFEIGVDDAGSLRAFQPLWIVQARASLGPAVR